MVKTSPKTGDMNRNPPDHQCQRPATQDGLCATHSPIYQAEKKKVVTANKITYSNNYKIAVNEAFDYMRHALSRNGIEPSDDIGSCADIVIAIVQYINSK